MPGSLIRSRAKRVLLAKTKRTSAATKSLFADHRSLDLGLAAK
jgi:hypothetical protein